MRNLFVLVSGREEKMVCFGTGVEGYVGSPELFAGPGNFLDGQGGAVISGGRVRSGKVIRVEGW
jgi:hypothetical protein